MTGRVKKRGQTLVTGILATVLLAACGDASGTTPRTPTTGTPAAGSPPPATTIPATTPAASGKVVVDPSLLALLPSAVSGVPLTGDPETAAALARDPSLAASITAIAVATAFGPAATDGETDYAVVTIVRLRPGTFSDAFFRDWRDTFDAAVCEQAGGVTGHAETTIEDHQTWIGTCAGGVHTWHAVLQDEAVLLSLQGSGANRFGEQVVAGLTE